MNEPPESQQWMTPEIRDLLNQIKGQHAAKQRRTIILLAFAKATQTPIAHVFDRDDTCASPIWWQKWQYHPDIAAAFNACLARALEWADEDLVNHEERHRRERRRSISEFSAKAPAALAAVMAGPDQKGADRINAAVTLINLADGQQVGPVASGSDTKIGDKDGLTIRVMYDDAEHPPTAAARIASGDPG